jgi:2-amino-4-hydroxy-6-hydroxymethyldihydropteridine diphosphokinase
VVLAYLSIGSNLGDRRVQMQKGLSALVSSDRVELQAVSSLYETSPVGGPPGQPLYLNAVVLIRSDLAPLEVLRRCQQIEELSGRIRRERWGARTLDIDILTWGDLSLDSDELVVPHPRLYERLFVLEPLLEIGVADGGGIDERRARSAVSEIRSRSDQAISKFEDASWWTASSSV